MNDVPLAIERVQLAAEVLGVFELAAACEWLAMGLREPAERWRLWELAARPLCGASERLRGPGWSAVDRARYLRLARAFRDVHHAYASLLSDRFARWSASAASLAGAAQLTLRAVAYLRGSSDEQARALGDIEAACARWNLTLAGGVVRDDGRGAMGVAHPAFAEDALGRVLSDRAEVVLVPAGAMALDADPYPWSLVGDRALSHLEHDGRHLVLFTRSRAASATRSSGP